MLNQGNNDLISGLQVFFARIPLERLKLLDSCYEDDGAEDDDKMPVTFAEPVPAFEHSKNKVLIVLIIDNAGQMIRAAVGRRGYSAGTGLSQIQLSHAQKTTVVSARSFADAVEPRFQSRVRFEVAALGLLPPGASRSLLNHLLTTTPEIRRVIEAAQAPMQNPLLTLPEQQQLRLQQESDAALTAMLIAVSTEMHIYRISQPHFPGSAGFLKWSLSLGFVKTR